MDGDDSRDSRHTPSPQSPRPDPDHSETGIVEGFLLRLFQDRFLTSSSPAASDADAAPPPQPLANNLVPFFAAESVFASSHPQPRQTSDAFTPPPMQRTQDVVFCVEDTVGLKDDKYSVGVVDRSFTDVDTHEPRPTMARISSATPTSRWPSSTSL